MSEAEDRPTEQSEKTVPEGKGRSAGAKAPARETISWQRVLTAVLLSGGLFLLLLNMGSILAPLAWLSCAVFLPVGIWLGRASCQPWLDGLVYGLVASLVVAAILTVSGFTIGAWGGAYSLFLVIPQALFGSWLGARLPSRETSL